MLQFSHILIQTILFPCRMIDSTIPQYQALCSSVTASLISSSLMAAKPIRILGGHGTYAGAKYQIGMRSCRKRLLS
jgi:hypothetical protein